MEATGESVPGGLISAEELRWLVADGEAETITLAIPDLHGRLVGKRHQARLFVDRLLGGGAEACAYLLATDVEMRPLPGFGIASWETGYGDVRVVPDLRTLRRLPWHRGGVLVLADVEQPDGQALSVAPRHVLREQIARLGEDLGLTAKVGLETEFTVYLGNGERMPRQLEPLSRRNLDYALIQPLGVSEYVQEIEKTLSNAGLPLEAVKPEAAPGQVEVTFRYGEPLTAADNHVAFKHIVKSVSPWTENSATFMAAPVTDVGNGLHVHLSLYRESDPVLPADQGGLSAIGAQAVAGLVQVLPQQLPLLLPTSNSYKRLRPRSFAPTRAAWGWDNRTCAVRVTGHGTARHLEIRIPGADANPYLTVAAVLAACRYGIKHELQPPSATTGNAYDAPGVPLLPSSLDVALSAFRASAAAAELLGKDVVGHYSAAAQIECDVAATRVTDIERERGFFDA